MKYFFYLTLFFIPFTSFCQWQKVENGIPGSNHICDITNFNNVLFGSIGSNYGLYWSFDNGNSWTFRGVLPSNIEYQNKLFRIKNDTIWLSLDSGLTFVSTNMFDNKSEINYFKNIKNQNYKNADNIVNYNDTLIIASIGKYYKSDDFGFTWHRFTYPPNFNTGTSQVFIRDSILYFLVNDWSAYMNGCISYFNQSVWQDLYCTSQTTFPNSFNISDAMFIDSLLFICTTDLKVRHQNGSVETVLNDGEWKRSIVIYGDTLYLSTSYNVFKAHKNNYYSWINISNGLPSNPAYETKLFIYKNYLFLVAYDGLYRLELNPLASTNTLNNNLEIKIFPNPATDNINIVLPNIYKNTDVVIIDLIGCVLKTGTIFGKQSNIDVSELPSGIYLLKVFSEQGVITKKIIIQH